MSNNTIEEKAESNKELKKKPFVPPTNPLPLFEKKNISSFFKKENIKNLSKEIIRPIVNIIYDELYPYIWFLCIYHVFLIFITLANLFLLIHFFTHPFVTSKQ